MQLLSTYLLAYAFVIELRSAPESKLVLVGTLLLDRRSQPHHAVREGDRRTKLSLTLAENEMREAELLHEQDQM